MHAQLQERRARLFQPLPPAPPRKAIPETPPQQPRADIPPLQLRSKNPPTSLGPPPPPQADMQPPATAKSSPATSVLQPLNMGMAAPPPQQQPKAPPGGRLRVELACGMLAWHNTSGHLINGAGHRIDEQGRLTKPRGAPGKGFTRRWEDARERAWHQQHHIWLQDVRIRELEAKAAGAPPPPPQGFTGNWQHSPPAASSNPPPAASSNPPPQPKSHHN